MPFLNGSLASRPKALAWVFISLGGLFGLGFEYPILFNLKSIIFFFFKGINERRIIYEN